MFTSLTSSPTWHRGRHTLAPELAVLRSQHLRHSINHTSILSLVQPPISPRPRAGPWRAQANATNVCEVKGFEAIIRVFIALRTLAGGRRAGGRRGMRKGGRTWEMPGKWETEGGRSEWVREE